MAWIVVDVEADGPCPGLYSMISFGAVVVEPELGRRFKGFTSPISEMWIPEVLAISATSREGHLAHPDPAETMSRFVEWLYMEFPERRLTFVSDNPAFDWQFVNYYLHRYVGSNPFGFSARRIGDLFSGWKGDARKVADWKRLRRTRHTHDPLDDAVGNAEALLALNEMGLKLPLGLGLDGLAR